MFFLADILDLARGEGFIGLSYMFYFISLGSFFISGLIVGTIEIKMLKRALIVLAIWVLIAIDAYKNGIDDFGPESFFDYFASALPMIGLVAAGVVIGILIRIFVRYILRRFNKESIFRNWFVYWPVVVSASALALIGIVAFIAMMLMWLYDYSSLSNRILRCNDKNTSRCYVRILEKYGNEVDPKICTKSVCSYAFIFYNAKGILKDQSIGEAINICEQIDNNVRERGCICKIKMLAGAESGCAYDEYF